MARQPERDAVSNSNSPVGVGRTNILGIGIDEAEGIETADRHTIDVDRHGDARSCLRIDDELFDIEGIRGMDGDEPVIGLGAEDIGGVDFAVYMAVKPDAVVTGTSKCFAQTIDAGYLVGVRYSRLAIQRGLEAHAHSNVTFGRNEAGNQLFHKWVSWYLAKDPSAPKPTL